MTLTRSFRPEIQSANQAVIRPTQSSMLPILLDALKFNHNESKGTSIRLRFFAQAEPAPRLAGRTRVAPDSARTFLNDLR
jgi:hypothetical protein